MLKKLQRNSRNNKKGFTLVELLAVIVILAIIAAIAVPIITNVLSSQREQANIQDALNIIHAAKLYDAENGVENGSGKDGGLSLSDLSKYIGHTSDTSSNIKVTSSNGVYSISGHKANSISGISTPATEQDLVNKSNR